MPGRNCAVFGCGSCRRTKGIGIWKLPLAVDDRHREWCEAWLGDQIKNDRVYTCKKHFPPENVEICKYFLVISCSCGLFTYKLAFLFRSRIKLRYDFTPLDLSDRL